MGPNPIPKILVITGPTGSGKSDLALKLASEYKAEIVSADSVQVYRGFDIGSAKPSAEELETVPHHLISILDPDQTFDVGEFCKRAHQTISEILGRGRLPLIVGGTGMYIRALLCGLAEIPEPSEEARRLVALKEREFSVAGENSYQSGAMHRYLRDLDPLTADELAVRDIARIRRALLVFLTTGEPIVKFQSSHGHEEINYDALVLTLLPEREKLYQAIEARVDQMFKAGLIEEVRELSTEFSPSLRPFNSIGYKETLAHLAGQLSFDDAVKQVKQATRRFAKRQYTWWHNEPSKLAWKRIPEKPRAAMQSFLKGELEECIPSIRYIPVLTELEL